MDKEHGFGMKKAEEYECGSTSTVGFNFNDISQKIPLEKSTNCAPKVGPLKDFAPLNQIAAETHFNLITLMIKHIDQDYLKPAALNNLKIQLKEFESTSNCKNIICSKCRKIKFLKHLKCGHSTCFYCFEMKVNELKVMPCLKNIRELVCKKCLNLPCEEDLCIFDKPENSLKWNQLEVVKKCSWCKRDLNVLNMYLFDLPCLHLCRDCYLDQIYMGSEKCITCNEKFKNLNITKERKRICFGCNVVDKIFSCAYRRYKNDFHLCYSCQNAFYNNQQFEYISTENNGNTNLKTFAYYINKTCPYCSNKKSLADIKICSTCENIVCVNCIDEGKTKCNTCSKVFN